MGRFESPLYGKGGKDGFGKLIVIAEAMKGRDHDTLHLSMKGVSLAAKDGMLSGGKSGKCQRSMYTSKILKWRSRYLTPMARIEGVSRPVLLGSEPSFSVKPL